MLRRFRPKIPDIPGRPFWIHACSIGEIEIARTLVAELTERFPKHPVLVTASTPTGLKRARRLFPGRSTYFPFEWPPAVSRFVKRVNPAALLLIETELWPLVLQASAARAVPVAIVNGRISDSSFPGYLRARPMLAPLLRRAVDRVASQSQADGDRFVRLGVPRDRVAACGNIKVDATVPRSESDRDVWRRTLGIPSRAGVVVFGSTHPGEEALAMQCWEALASAGSTVWLIVAPRHIERAAEARSALRRGPATLRSRLGNTPDEADRGILVLDTHGELRASYAIATVAVIGGSFYPGIGGHNPLEPAAEGVATVFGPYMDNFAEAAASLVEGNGAIQVDGPDTLPETLVGLLADESRRSVIGRRGREIVEHARGATRRSVDHIEKSLTTPYKTECDSTATIQR